MPLITPATAETLVRRPIYAVQNALPPRFQPNASWMLNLSIINTLRQFETTNGALKFPALQDNPPMLLGRTVYENSNMDGTFDAAATANNYLLLYGDFREFRRLSIVSAPRSSWCPISWANRRPTGQRGALLVVPHRLECGGAASVPAAVHPDDLKKDAELSHSNDPATVVQGWMKSLLAGADSLRNPRPG